MTLAERYGYPPFSVIDRRSKVWQDRKRAWLSLGLRSEEGRDPGLQNSGHGFRERLGTSYTDAVSRAHSKINRGSSVFDPELASLAYRWFSGPGQLILDPFAGGSVRGIVASRLGRRYVGVDLSERQIQANRTQLHLAGDEAPEWLCGDAANVLAGLPTASVDMIFSCPPYHNLERYSQDPRDLSAMSWDEFLIAYGVIVREAVRVLRPDRFAAFVVSDLRGPRGSYRGLTARTIGAFEDAGAELHNDLVLLDPIGSSALKAARPFDVSRKVTRVHQHLLVFVKGDARRAAALVDAGDWTDS